MARRSGARGRNGLAIVVYILIAKLRNKRTYCQRRLGEDIGKLLKDGSTNCTHKECLDNLRVSYRKYKEELAAKLGESRRITSSTVTKLTWK